MERNISEKKWFAAGLPSRSSARHGGLQTGSPHRGGAESVPSVTKEYVRTLPWDRFEALVAVLEEKRGAQVYLTPGRGDDKADVIAIFDTRVRVVQCKHTAWGASMDADSLAEVLMALEIYGHRHLRAVSQRGNLQPVVVTNGTFTKAAKSEGRERDVELVSEGDLWTLLEQTPCTPGDIEAMEARRLASMADLRAALERARMRHG